MTDQPPAAPPPQAPSGGPAQAAFSMSDATFNAFRRREKRFVLLGATVGYLIVAAVLYATFLFLFLFLVRDALADYMAWAIRLSETTTPDASILRPPESVLAAIPYALLMGVLFYVLFAAYEAACLRWLVRGEAGGGLLGLKLDADTARVFLIYLAWLGLFIACYIGLLILGFVFATVRLPAGLFAVLLLTVFFGALIFFGVRFAPAAATTIARRQFSFFPAWTVTKGRFWALFGAFAFIVIIYIVAAIVIYSVFFALAMGGVMPNIADVRSAPDPQALAAIMAAPGMITALILLYALLITLYSTVVVTTFGVSAYAASAAQREGRI